MKKILFALCLLLPCHVFGGAAGFPYIVFSGGVGTNITLHAITTIAGAGQGYTNSYFYITNNCRVTESVNTNLIYVSGATTPAGANGVYSNAAPGHASQAMKWTNTVGVFGIVYDPDLNTYDPEWALTNNAGTVLFVFSSLDGVPNGTWTASGGVGSPVVHFGTNFTTNCFPDLVVAGSPLLWEATNTFCWVDPVAGNNATFRKGRRGLPAATLLAAVSQATNIGDTIIALPGTHTLSSHLSLTIGTRLIGFGPKATVLNGTSAGYGIHLASNSVVSGITIDHSAMTGNTYGTPFDNGSVDALNFLVEDCDVIGYSDAFYFTQARFSGVVNRCRIWSQWDAYFDSASAALTTDTIEFNNCAWNLVNTNNNWPGSGFGKPVGIRAGNTKVIFNTGTIIATSTFTNVACVDALDPDSRVELNSVMLVPSGTPSSWAITNGSGGTVIWRGAMLNSSNISGTVTFPNTILFYTNGSIIVNGGQTNSGPIQANTFYGSGAGLTAVPATALPATVTTNNGTLTSGRVMLGDGGRGVTTAAASGAVPIDADGSATTFAQINALAANNLITNNWAAANPAVVISNDFKIDIAHGLIASNSVTAGVLSVSNTPNGSYIYGTNGSLVGSNFNGGYFFRTTNANLRLNGDAGTVAYAPSVSLWDINANSASRNWALVAGFNNFGDLTILQSSAKAGDPVSAGSTRAIFGANGKLIVGVSSAAPTAQLQVVGDIVASTTGTFTNGIIGHVAASAAASGIVGEVISSLVASGSAVSLTTDTAANVTSISLTAGDWDVSGSINFAGSSATYSGARGGITTTTATVPTDGTEVYSGVQFTVLSATDGVTIAPKQINVSSTTTVYLVGRATFSAGTVSAFGAIRARRVR